MNKLRELRKENNLTLRELAHNTGVSFGALGNYEKERREPSYEMWQKLANYFGVSVLYLQGKKKTSEQIQLDLQYLENAVKLDYSRFKKMGDGLGGIDVFEDDDKVSALYDELLAYLSDTGGSRNKVIQLLDEAKCDVEKFEREQLQQAHGK